jgi:hypothetical protein
MLTNADFAERACYLAKSIADWAGNSLALREHMNEPMSTEALGRFAEYVRGRLASLERDSAAGAADGG